MQRYTYERADYVDTRLYAIFDTKGEGGNTRPIAYAKDCDAARLIVDKLNKVSKKKEDKDEKDDDIYDVLFGG